MHTPVMVRELVINFKFKIFDKELNNGYTLLVGIEIEKLNFNPAKQSTGYILVALTHL